MAAPVSTNANTLAVITNEVLANSLGGTLVANNVQLSNLTANGSIIQFILGGQSLPITFGSETIYPPVLVNIYAGANGNTTDQLLMGGNVIPTVDQQGAFLIEGTLVLKANGKAGGGNVNTVWGGSAQIPGAALGGGVKTITNLYVGPTSNGNVNAQLVAANTCNLSFFVQPQTGQNTNASITQLVLFAPIGVI